MATRRKSQRTLSELERAGRGPMKASLRLPSEERGGRYTATGLRTAREAAGMTQAELARASGYSVGIIASMEGGKPFHTLSISRASTGLPEPHNDLRLIRDD